MDCMWPIREAVPTVSDVAMDDNDGDLNKI